MNIAGYFEDASSDERRLCCSLWWIERGIIYAVYKIYNGYRM